MPRLVSFIVLLAILLIIGSVFFQVMLNFLIPLFLAGVLVVIFEPLHKWVGKRLPGRPRLVAMLTTAGILLTVLLPLVWLGVQAYAECSDVVISLLKDDDKRSALIASVERRAESSLEFYEESFGLPLDLSALAEKGLSEAAQLLLGSFQAALGVLFGLAILILAVYFFLLDGPKMLGTIMQLSPLDDKYELELLHHFTALSRAVVLASLLSAVAQGLLAGLGYFFALPAEAPIFLLTMLTMALAIVPFVGSTAVWAPVCIYLYLFAEHEVDGAVVQGDTFSAIALAIYCAAIVSPADNFIKPMVLHGQSNLHPLLALLSVLGGVQVLGPIGILVGPMLVAFVQALLNMINSELQQLSKEEKEKKGKKTG